jgi:S-(hydroxymethyl)glutathione dehydrogenase/alcohol dehydrogenase
MLLQGEAVSDHTFRIHTANGQPVYPMTLLGTFSPYMVVHEASAVKIDKDIPFEVAALVRLRHAHRLRLVHAQRRRSAR